MLPSVVVKTGSLFPFSQLLKAHFPGALFFCNRLWSRLLISILINAHLFIDSDSSLVSESFFFNRLWSWLVWFKSLC
jgi:hypothetical protein